MPINVNIRDLAKKYQSLLSKYSLEFRAYQFWLLNAILKAVIENKNIIIELDAGMGKRILMFLITQLLEKQRILILTPSRASVWDMTNDFYRLTGNKNWFGSIVGGLSARFKQWILENSRVIIATPISLYNIMKKRATKFDVIIINEVDKTIKRVADLPQINNDSSAQLNASQNINYALVHPWNHLVTLLPTDSIWIGLSGTLRDRHIIKIEDRVHIWPELESIIKFLFPKNRPVTIISMTTLIEKTDVTEHIIKNLTLIKPIPIQSPDIETIDYAITQEIEHVIEQIRTIRHRMFPDERTPLDTHEKVIRSISLLPRTDPLKIKFLRLALARRHLYASPPSIFRRFLNKPMFRRILREYTGYDLNDVLLEESPKIQHIKKIVLAWLDKTDKIIILTSFIRTALSIKDAIERLIGRDKQIFLLTGRTPNKRRILDTFKKTGGILILTPIAERDLDFPSTSVLIIHDIISTVKSMYQRIKRARRGLVLILYYKNTYEEKKLNILLARLAKRYPWSIRIYQQ